MFNMYISHSLFRNFEEYPYVWMVVLENDMSHLMIHEERRHHFTGLVT